MEVLTTEHIIINFVIVFCYLWAYGADITETQNNIIIVREMMLMTFHFFSFDPIKYYFS